MALYDMADPAVSLPAQLVVDTSLLLALRPGDDNPHAAVARAFIQRIGEQVTACEMVAWLPLSVVQECYHAVLSNGLRRAWEAMPPATRPPNWLRAYKENPALLQAYIPELARFRELLAAIPLTPIQPDDLTSSAMAEPLDERMLHFPRLQPAAAGRADPGASRTNRRFRRRHARPGLAAGQRVRCVHVPLTS